MLLLRPWPCWQGLVGPHADAQVHPPANPPPYGSCPAPSTPQAGVSATVVDARFCKPLDTVLIRQLAREHPVMITVEEGSIGGFAAHVMQVGGGGEGGKMGRAGVLHYGRIR